MLIVYTTQCCSTAGEVITTALNCKHWSYSLGEHSVILARVGTQTVLGEVLLFFAARHCDHLS